MGSTAKKRSRPRRKKEEKSPAKGRGRVRTRSVPGYRVAWASQEDRQRTRGANTVRGYASEVVGEVVSRIPRDFMWIIRNHAYDLRLVSLDEKWAARAGSVHAGCKQRIDLNALWFVRRANRREELVWLVAVAYAEVYIEAMSCLARIGYREARKDYASYSTNPRDWDRRGYRFNRNLERVIRAHAGRSGGRKLAEGVAKAWGFRQADAPKLDCLRCTPDGLVEKRRCGKPVSDTSVVTPPVEEVDAAKLAATLTSMQGQRDQAAKKVKEDAKG